MRLSDFRVLSFDCYGTLIDWEKGIYEALQPLLSRADPEVSRERALESFARHESEQEAETPRMLYSELLAVVHRRLAAEWNAVTTADDDGAFGRSVPAWPAFPDSAAALRYLKSHFKLVILSNVDRRSFEGSRQRLGVAFDAVYTAQDIGSYKPSQANFRYLLDGLAERGFERKEILHVAQSLFHDHAPAQGLGLASAWIDRGHEQSGGGATPPPPAGVRYDFHFHTLADLAAAHRAELAR